jgi:hypothetical protein
MKCSDKWGKGHRCPKQIPLHILEEVLDAMHQMTVALRRRIPKVHQVRERCSPYQLKLCKAFKDRRP